MRTISALLMAIGFAVMIGAYFFPVAVTTEATDPARYWESSTVANWDMVAQRAMVHEAGAALMLLGGILFGSSVVAAVVAKRKTGVS